jgi:hypothetical protein
MWETIRLLISQWGWAGVLLVGVVFFLYILYIDKNKQADKDSAREERLNQMTDRIIEITAQVSTVVGSNTEVFREVSQRLVELRDTNVSDHKVIINEIEKVDNNAKSAHERIEDKIIDIKSKR